jgi:hypothetical protein
MHYWNIPTNPAWNLSAYRGMQGDAAPDVKFQYSADGENWHDAFDPNNDIYMRTSSDDGETWSEAMQFIQDTSQVVEVDEVTAAVLCYLNARIDGIIEALTNGLPSLKVEELTIARKLVAYITEGNALSSGEGAPTILPQYNGQEYFDTTNKVWYKAAFTGVEPTAAAWKQITNA